MPLLLDLVLSGLGLLCLVPAALFTLECVLAPREHKRPRLSPTLPLDGPGFVVLIPAHNEALGIQRTLARIQLDLRPQDRVVVIADNCTDDTAGLARAEGAEVIERTHATERGKGYALSYAFLHLQDPKPAVVVVVDADCLPAPGALGQLAAVAAEENRPVQADYLLESEPEASLKARVSAFALRVKNRVRPGGLTRLGLPVPLTGSGMAFPWKALEAAPPMGSWLVEDMLLGIELTRLGYPPRYLRYAEVRSELPPGSKAAFGQRRRWEHGHLSTLLRNSPRLLMEGLTRRRLDLVVTGADLAIPPIALFVVVLLGLTTLSGLAFLFAGARFAFPLALIDLSILTFGVLWAWFGHARDLLSPSEIASIPLYILWKIPLYVSFITRGQHKKWERTQRKEEG
jgi:cellulose synthase/poly-beta-1,6-N-acetylglucosamine synthase-like glycosyltransferase